MTKVNTVLGPVSPDELGITLMHEHVVFGYPGWEGDQTMAPFDHEEIVNKAVDVLEELKILGLKTFVDATPLDGGRNVDILKEVSEKTGINVICSTGYYYEEEGAPVYWKFHASLGDVSARLYELFHKEVTEGVRGTGIKAGVIKVGCGKGEITAYEKMLHQAAAEVSRDTGVPIITHTQAGTMAPEQTDFLIANGADPAKIQIGHMCDNLDIRYQEETLKKGVYVAWDRMGLQGLAGCPMDADRYGVLIEMIKKGYADRLMISHDAIISWLGRAPDIPEAALPLIVNWHPSHLFKNIIPALKDGGVTDEQIQTIIVDNPRHLFGGK